MMRGLRVARLRRWQLPRPVLKKVHRLAMAAVFGAVAHLIAFPSSAETVSTGTGFFVNQDGLIATCYHVLEGNAIFKVRDSNGRLHAAALVTKDVANDLALIQIDQKKTPSFAIRKSSDVRKGEEVFVLGFPNIQMQGTDAKVTQGIISAISGIGGEPNSFQISAAVQPGNSGGPLFDRAGNVIGVVSAKLSQTAALKASGVLPENVNYAVKSNYLIEMISTARKPHSVVANPTSKPSPDSVASIVARAEQNTVLVIASSLDSRSPSTNTHSTPRPSMKPSPAPDAGGVSPNGSCVYPTDCAAGQTCFGIPRTCVDKRRLGETCNINGDCEGRNLCGSGGRCELPQSYSPRGSKSGGPKACWIALDCPGAQVCIAGSCSDRKALGSACQTSEQCEGLLICVEQSCGARRLVGERCQTDADCEHQLGCASGRCRSYGR